MRRKAAKGIKIISDEIEEDKDFNKAHVLINQAQRIYFIGFGYHPINIERLKIREATTNKLIKGSSFGLTDLMCEQIENNIKVEKYSLCHVPLWKNLDFVRERVLLD